MRQIINSSIDLRLRIKTPAELDYAVQMFTSIIVQTAADATPDKEVVVNREILFPRDIRNMVQKRREARKRWQRTRNRVDKALFNKLSKETEEMIRKVNQRSLEDYLVDLSPNKESDYSLWKATRRLKYPHANESPIRNTSGQWIRTDQDKSNAFATYLGGTFQPNKIESKLELKTSKSTPEPIALFTPKEVARAIDDLNVNKATGMDRANHMYL